MIRLADQIELRGRLDVAVLAAVAETVLDLVGAAYPDLGALGRDVEVKIFPVLGDRIEARLALDHHFGRDQLHDRTDGIDAAFLRAGHGNGGIEIAIEIADEEAVHRGQIADTAKARIRDILGRQRRGDFFLRRFRFGAAPLRDQPGQPQCRDRPQQPCRRFTL